MTRRGEARKVTPPACRVWSRHKKLDNKLICKLAGWFGLQS